MTERAASLAEMIRRRPHDARLRFGLALEYLGQGRLNDAVDALRTYLDMADDEGNAWGRLAGALHELGRDDEALEAYRRGVEVATRHGHPTMADEFEELMTDIVEISKKGR